MSENYRVGDLLILANKISESQLAEALRQQKKERSKCLEEILVDLGFVKESDILEVLENQLKIPSVDLANYKINPQIISFIPENIARRYSLIPIDKKDNRLIVAMSDPFNIYAIDDVRLLTGLEIDVVVSLKSVILRTIDKFYREEKTKKVLEEFEEAYIPSSIEELNDKDISDVNSAPVVRLVNSIVGQAIKMNASDIHIEPFKNNVKVRYRIDGDLQEIMRLPIKSHMAIVTRIKIMGKMDIAERRIPQDGRVEIGLEGKEIDLRISSLPTVYGEKIVIRLLDRNGFSFSKEDLGFEDRDLKIFDKIIKQPHGIILVTGPTGSGKSTTLYTMLKELNVQEKNIITVEDPVEYKLDGINQVQVNYKSGLTFSKALRSILRQDPDIIMIGEIRDSETAEISVRASITGHLVLSTLHTNDTASTIVRLIDMGIEPYLVSTSVIGVISQRLVKKLCPSCKSLYELSSQEKRILGLNPEDKITMYRPIGCNKCIKGYKGRVAIFEIMDLDKDIRRLIDSRATTDEIKEAAIKNGMKTLYDNVVSLALRGITSVEEVFRIGYTLD